MPTFAPEVVAPYAYFVWQHSFNKPVSDGLSEAIWLFCEAHIDVHADWDFYTQASWMLSRWDLGEWKHETGDNTA